MFKTRLPGSEKSESSSAKFEQPGRCLTSNEVFTDTHMPRTNSHMNM